MPATFLMRVEVLLPDTNGKLVGLEVPSLANDGVCFVDRPGGKDMRLVLTEDHAKALRKPSTPSWRRSADRTGLHADSLLTGNFTGKISISGLKELIANGSTGCNTRSITPV
jgi:hypothetical protein